MKKRKIELAIQVFDSFEEAERSEKEFWWKQSPIERLRQAELLRKINYGRANPARSFRDFLKLLNERKLECPLIGGCAAFYHGYPRATEGIDLALKT